MRYCMEGSPCYTRHDEYPRLPSWESNLIMSCLTYRNTAPNWFYTVTKYQVAATVTEGTSVETQTDLTNKLAFWVEQLFLIRRTRVQIFCVQWQNTCYLCRVPSSNPRYEVFFSWWHPWEPRFKSGFHNSFCDLVVPDRISWMTLEIYKWNLGNEFWLILFREYIIPKLFAVWNMPSGQAPQGASI